MSSSSYQQLYCDNQYNNRTVDVAKFARLNFCGFNPTEVFVEILSHFLIQKCSLLKSGTYIHGKTFMVLLKATKKPETLALQIFPVYSIDITNSLLLNLK